MSETRTVFVVEWRRGSGHRWVKVCHAAHSGMAARIAAEWLEDIGGQVRVTPRSTSKERQ